MPLLDTPTGYREREACLSDFGWRFVAKLREGGASDEMIRKQAVSFVETFVAAVEDALMNL